MMSRWNKVIAIIVLMALALMAGALQEWLKVNINFHLDSGVKISGYDQMNAAQREHAVNAFRFDAPYDYYYNHNPITSLSHFSTSELAALKWLVTVGFVIAFLVLNAAIVWIMYRSGKLLRWMVYLYITFFFLSFAFYLTGIAIGEREHFYNVARKITGALQSLVPLMLIVPAWWFSRESRVTLNN